jgi:hypothetical protein
MKSYRVVALGMMIVMVVGLSNQANAAGHKPYFTAKHSYFKHKLKHKRLLQSRRHLRNITTQQTQQADVHKPLDLDVPFKDLDNSNVTRQINSVNSNTESGLFTENNQTKQRALQVKGEFVMSQDPEAGKKKTADGAAIVINLRP